MKLYYLIVILVYINSIIITQDKRLRDNNEVLMISDDYKTNNNVVYTYLPDDVKELDSIKYKIPRIIDNEYDKHRANSEIINQRFQDVIKDIKSLKIDIFGNAEESMDFYKRNRNAYDPKLLERSMKIAKILELEELLEFYQRQHIDLNEIENSRKTQQLTRLTYNESNKNNAIINITSNSK
jgi:hypothetical protein